jgi:vitamin B12 transporter
VQQQCLAQEKKLKVVKVRQQRTIRKRLSDEKLNGFAPGMKILTVDSQWMAQYALQNLSQLLTQQIPVFVKSYGINSMATLNFRGSSSAQSQVLWNGVPLNSASSGMTDVSMLSVNNFDQIDIAYGGSSALLGSGNVGAALLLNNNFNAIDTHKKWQTKMGAETGSFGQYKLSLQEYYSSKKMFLSLKFMHQQANNNFSYEAQNKQRIKLSNAALLSNSVMLNFGYHFSANTHLKFSVWHQYFNREIPPAMFELLSLKQQEDEALRCILDIETVVRKKNKLYTKTSFSQEGMVYKDASIGLYSHNTIYQYFQEFGWKRQFHPRHEFLLFLPINITWTLPVNDSQTRYQKRAALAGAYHYKACDNKLLIALNARFEQINMQSVFLAGTNASFSFHPFFKIRGNIQSSYRAPTLNEWYYLPGGNINLKPEKGWNIDAGYELKIPINTQWSIQHDVSIFNRQIKDWILWFGGSIWTPHNIAEVNSRGLETNNNLIWKKADWKIYAGLNTSFVLATTVQSYIPNDGSIGKQIPYSPRYNGQANIGFSFKKISLNYNHTYTGYRFITTDESQFLKPYQTGNFYAAFSYKIKKLDCSVNARYNNAWNEIYQVVNLRPMPRGNWAIGLSFVY